MKIARKQEKLPMLHSFLIIILHFLLTMKRRVMNKMKTTGEVSPDFFLV